MLYDCSTENTYFRFLCTGVATPTLTGGDASVHIPYYLRRRTGSKILVDSVPRQTEIGRSSTNVRYWNLGGPEIRNPVPRKHEEREV